jgi:hypothetical protein
MNFPALIKAAWNNKSLTILIVLSAADACLTLIAILYDPGQIPSEVSNVLAGITIIAGGTMLCVILTEYLREKQAKDWRIDLLRFILLYFCLLVGFANLYYVLQTESKIVPQFKVTKDPDPQLNNQVTRLDSEIDEKKLVVADAQAHLDEIQARPRKGPPDWFEAAKNEYTKQKEFLHKKSTLAGLIGEATVEHLSTDRIEKNGVVRIDPDVNALVAESVDLQNKLDKLDQQLINQYEDYLVKDAEEVQTANYAGTVLRTAQRELEMLKAEEGAQVNKYFYFNFVYFSAVTMSTVGYGDISPLTRWSKMLVTSQILLGGGLVLIYLSLILGRAGKPTGVTPG